MAEKNSLLKRIGAYVLGGSLVVGATEYANAQNPYDSFNLAHKTYSLFEKKQDKSQAKKTSTKGANKKRNPIVAREDHSVADSSRFLVSTYTPLEISRGSSYDLTEKLGSKNAISYRVMDPNNKKDAKALEKDLKKVKNNHLRRQYTKLINEAKKKGGLNAFNEAIKDGKIDTSEVYRLNPGTYVVEIKTPYQSVVRIVKVKPGKLEQVVEQAVGEAKPSVGVEVPDTSYVAIPDTTRAMPDTTTTVPDTTYVGRPDTSYVAQVDSSDIGIKGMTRERWEKMSRLERREFNLLLTEKEKPLHLSKIREWMDKGMPSLRDETRKPDTSYVEEKAEELIEEAEERGFEFGPRVWGSNTNEIAGEVFFNHPVLGDLRLGGFLGWSARKGKNYFESQGSGYEIVTRNVKNTSPTRTETRVDETFGANSSRTEPLGEGGIELSYPLWNWAEIFSGAGVKALREKNENSNTYLSTITQFQNMAQTGQQVLNDGPVETKTLKDKAVPSWRVGFGINPFWGLKLKGMVKGVKGGKPQISGGLEYAF